ncbi:hypothetical protein E2C01_095968 [Portunus trituberculatus]|uniref:Uncharacterized protein n=1 Tax=Portunus trituberculatus TaxID=210409 RepID=A0A5B7JWR4_PORTR|nr:hypothetical protein [Portunus trituberculatus]
MKTTNDSLLCTQPFSDSLIRHYGISPEVVACDGLISGTYGEASLRSEGREVQFSEDTVLIYSVNT